MVRFGMEFQEVLWQEPRARFTGSNAGGSDSWSTQVPAGAENGSEVLRLIGLACFAEALLLMSVRSVGRRSARQEEEAVERDGASMQSRFFKR